MENINNLLDDKRKFKEIQSYVSRIRESCNSYFKYKSKPITAINFAHLDDDNIKKYANFGIAYTRISGINDIFRQNFDTQEKVDNYLKNLDVDTINMLMRYIIETTAIIYDDEYTNTTIKECVQCYFEGKYNVCTNTLCCIFEELIESIGEVFQKIEKSKYTFSSNKKFYGKIIDRLEYIENMYEKLETENSNDISNLTFMESVRFLSIFAITKNMFVNTESKVDCIPNRHELAHGKRIKNYNKIDCLKLYIFLASLFEFLVPYIKSGE